MDAPFPHSHATPPAAAFQASSDLKSLLTRCIAGERKAQRQLYDTYSPALYGVIRRYVRDEHGAQDMLSEAFIRIFARLQQYSFEGAFEGWMRKITVHAVTDYFRKNQKHIEAGRTEPEDTFMLTGNDAVSRLSFRELLAVVHELPDTQRAVFNLFVFEEYSHKEIATSLSITENNSRWHLNDARRRLKEKITSMKP